MPHFAVMPYSMNASRLKSRSASRRARPASDPFADPDILVRREAAFGQAVRHSLLVARLRKFIPIFLAGSVVLTGLWLWLDPLNNTGELPVSVGKITIAGSKLKMEAPRLTGFSKDGRPYSVTAEAALQDLKKPSVIELSKIVGHFSQSGRDMVLNAASGVYDSKADKMHIFGGIDFHSNDGQSGRLSEATIETKKGYLVSDQPVDLYFKEGNLRGERMEVFDHGKVIVFEGGVSMTLNPDSKTAAVSPDTATQ
jgi:lipopolysaccharide export system protein LptC